MQYLAKDSRSTFKIPNTHSQRVGNIRYSEIVEFVGVPFFDRDYEYRELQAPHNGWVCFANIQSKEVYFEEVSE